MLEQNGKNPQTHFFALNLTIILTKRKSGLHDLKNPTWDEERS